jgi:hypothetical protein
MTHPTTIRTVLNLIALACASALVGCTSLGANGEPASILGTWDLECGSSHGDTLVIGEGGRTSIQSLTRGGYDADFESDLFDDSTEVEFDGSARYRSGSRTLFTVKVRDGYARLVDADHIEAGWETRGNRVVEQWTCAGERK